MHMEHIRNREEQIAGAGNIERLCKIIQGFGEVITSNGSAQSADSIEIFVNDIRYNRTEVESIRRITRTHGIRKKVAELLNIPLDVAGIDE
jgi:hypothetical protein